MEPSDLIIYALLASANSVVPPLKSMYSLKLNLFWYLWAFATKTSPITETVFWAFAINNSLEKSQYYQLFVKFHRIKNNFKQNK